MEKVADVVSVFRRAKKQMAILQEHQTVPSASFLSVITRWNKIGAHIEDAVHNLSILWETSFMVHVFKSLLVFKLCLTQAICLSLGPDW